MLHYAGSLHPATNISVVNITSSAALVALFYPSEPCCACDEKWSLLQVPGVVSVLNTTSSYCACADI